MAQPMAVKEVSVEEAKAELETLLTEVARKDTQVMNDDVGRVIARIVPSDDPEEVRQRFFARADALQARMADVPPRELGRLIDRAVADIRSVRRREATRAAGRS